MGRKLPTPDRGIFPIPERQRHAQKYNVLAREFAKRAGLPTPGATPYDNLGNTNLPVHRKKRDIQEAIRDNQISMVEGPTGSGKSTQIAKYALEMGYKKVVYLEPRVLLADNLSDRMSDELDEELGVGEGQQLVGVRHSGSSSGRGKAVEIMTPATYMRVMDELSEYDDEPLLVVADEIHEKDFETELAVAASVEEVRKHPKWRLLLASATLDSKSIHEAYSTINNRPIPLVSVEGRPHELERIDEPDLTAVEALAKYIEGHKKVLLFTAGKQEIHSYIDEIKGQKLANMRVNPLHAKLSHRDIKRATHADLADNERQSIVSTNAGQSGITIPELTLVISDGMTRRPHLDPDGTPGLVTSYCTQDELIQQAGRAGRDVGGGMVVYTKPDSQVFAYKGLEERDPQSPAQIYHTNISRNVLLATAIGKNFYELNKLLIHKVDQRTILDSYEVLYRLGAIDERNEITPLGKQINRFPLRPELGRAVVEAMNRGADRETMQHLVAMVSAVESGGLPYFEKGVSEKWRQDIRETTDDDYIAQADMFYATRRFYHGDYVEEADLEARNYDTKNTYRAHRTFDKICRELGINQEELVSNPPREEVAEELRDYILSGMFDYVHRKVASQDSSLDKEYINIWGGDEATRRKLSKRGTYKADDSLVVGMPRGFEKTRKGQTETHYVIENVMPTSTRKLAKYVVRLAERQPREPKIVGGRLVREDDLWFGDVHVGTEPSVTQFAHTTETKQQILEAAFGKPTQTVAELVAIKKELETLMRLTPVDKVNDYFPNGILTDEWLKRRIEDATTDSVDSIIAMDNNLRAMVSQKRIDLDTWVASEVVDQIRKNSPEFVELGENTYSLYYTHGMPIINGFNLRDADLLPDGNWTLPDGREILINYRINSSDTKRYSAGTVKQYAKSLD